MSYFHLSTGAWPQAAGGAVFLLYRWLKPTPVDAKYEALPCR